MPKSKSLVSPPAVAEPKRGRGRPRLVGVDKSLSVVGLPSKQAQMLVLNCESLADWCALVATNRLPLNLSPRIDLELGPKSWPGWARALHLAKEPTVEELASLPTLLPTGFIEFTYAKKMARTLNCRATSDWYVKAGELHPCVPREPWKVYFNKGFTTLEDFIGI